MSTILFIFPKKLRDSIMNLDKFLGFLLLSGAFITVILNFLHQSCPYYNLYLLEDDYFYYAKIAQRLVHEGRMSFDGLDDTNGFHPLWMLLLVGLTLIFPTQGASYFFVLMLVTAGIAILGAYSFSVMVKRWIPESTVPNLSAVLYYALIWNIGVMGMESTLTLAALPIFVLVSARAFEKNTLYNFMFAGIFAGIVVLSRLDSFLMIIGLSVGIAWNYRRLPAIASLAAFILGGTAVLCPYLLFNFIHFGTMMPISGLAKSLKLADSSFISFNSLLSNFIIGSRWAVKSTTLWIIVAIFTIFVRTLYQGSNDGAKKFIVFCTFSIISALSFSVFTAIRSDWPLWSWYNYNLYFASTCCFQVLLERLWHPGPLIRRRLANFLLVGFTLYWGIVEVFGLGRQYSTSYISRGVAVKNMLVGEPGIYAMGDGAGSIGYLLPYPVLQLEGLVADQSLLDAIRAQKNLIDLLNDRHVTYYISIAAKQNTNGCWYVREPNQAGPGAPSMNGEFCAHPRHEILASGNIIRVFSVADMMAGRAISPSRR